MLPFCSMCAANVAETLRTIGKCRDFFVRNAGMPVPDSYNLIQTP